MFPYSWFHFPSNSVNMCVTAWTERPFIYFHANPRDTRFTTAASIAVDLRGDRIQYAWCTLRRKIHGVLSEVKSTVFAPPQHWPMATNIFFTALIVHQGWFTVLMQDIALCCIQLIIHKKITLQTKTLKSDTPMQCKDHQDKVWVSSFAGLAWYCEPAFAVFGHCSVLPSVLKGWWPPTSSLQHFWGLHFHCTME